MKARTPEDDGQLVGTADGAVDIHHPLEQPIQFVTLVEDQIVAILDLGHVELMAIAHGAFLGSEKGDQLSHPGVDQRADVLRTERVGEFLQTLRVGAVEEAVVTPAKGDAFLFHLAGQPIVAIDPDADVEGEVGADTDEHAAATRILNVEVVEIDPAACQGDGILLLGEADGQAFGFAGFEDDSDTGLSVQPLEVRFDPILAANVLGRYDDVSTLLCGEVLGPVVIVIGELAEGLSCQEAELALEAEKTDHPTGILKAVDGTVEDNTVETGVAEANGVAMMGDERVHEDLLRATILGIKEVSVYCERGGLRRGLLRGIPRGTPLDSPAPPEIHATASSTKCCSSGGAGQPQVARIADAVSCWQKHKSQEQ